MKEVPLEIVLKVGGIRTGSRGEGRGVFQVEGPACAKAQWWDSERPSWKAGWAHVAEVLDTRMKGPWEVRDLIWGWGCLLWEDQSCGTCRSCNLLGRQ